MTSIEEQLQLKVVNEPDFLAVSGSRLYGTNREDSDHDFRGFVMPRWII
jgi:predicted nucleotidyltransferase